MPALLAPAPSTGAARPASGPFDRFTSFADIAPAPVHALRWFEVPAIDLDRAQRFYEQVLGTPLRRAGDGPHAMVLFPSDADGVGGCLCVGCEDRPPAAAGTVVYLSTPRLDDVLARVPGAGGRVAAGKTALPDGWGWCAHITDTEGNRVGLHAPA